MADARGQFGLEQTCDGTTPRGRRPARAPFWPDHARPTPTELQTAHRWCADSGGREPTMRSLSAGAAEDTHGENRSATTPLQSRLSDPPAFRSASSSPRWGRATRTTPPARRRVSAGVAPAQAGVGKGTTRPPTFTVAAAAPRRLVGTRRVQVAAGGNWSERPRSPSPSRSHRAAPGPGARAADALSGGERAAKASPTPTFDGSGRTTGDTLAEAVRDHQESGGPSLTVLGTLLGAKPSDGAQTVEAH